MFQGDRESGLSWLQRGFWKIGESFFLKIRRELYERINSLIIEKLSFQLSKSKVESFLLARAMTSSASDAEYFFGPFPTEFPEELSFSLAWAMASTSDSEFPEAPLEPKLVTGSSGINYSNFFKTIYTQNHYT